MVVATAAWAEQTDDRSKAIRLWRSGAYKAAYNSFLDYRQNNSGSMLIDYMWASSACRAGADSRSWGAKHLQTVINSVTGMAANDRSIITVELTQCQSGHFSPKPSEPTDYQIPQTQSLNSLASFLIFAPTTTHMLAEHQGGAKSLTEIIG
jgi:hypothetical protein